MSDCIFCRIIAGLAPAHVICERADVIVFVSLETHSLVVPKVHVPDIHGLDDTLGAANMSTAIEIANATRRALDCDGIYVTQANGAAAGQDVFHYHMHIYPRWLDSRGLLTGDASRATMASEIRLHL